MMILKQTSKCQRCGGSLAAESDRHGAYVRCLMCPFSVDITRENTGANGATNNSIPSNFMAPVTRVRHNNLPRWQAMSMVDSGRPWE